MTEALAYQPLADRTKESARRFYEKLLKGLRVNHPEMARQLEAGKLKILDIGAGKGCLDEELKRLGNFVVALDSEKIEEGFTPRIVADAHSLPFANEEFDIVVCLGITDAAKYPKNNIPQILDEVNRVLKNKGLFVDLYARADKSLSYRRYLQLMGGVGKTQAKTIFENKFTPTTGNILQKNSR